MRKCQGLLVTRREQLCLTMLAAVPYRADGVDDVLGRQPVALRDLGLPSFAAA